MAEYIYVENSNNVIVIDDQYQNYSFVDKYIVKTDTNQKYLDNGMGGKLLPYSGYSIAQPDRLDELKINNKTVSNLSFYRSRNGQPVIGSVKTNYADPEKKIIVSKQAYAYSLMLNDEAEVCQFTTIARKPSEMGLVVWNDQGEVVFDAMRGFLQVVDVINVSVDVRGGNQRFLLSNKANLVPFDKLFISTLSESYPFIVTGGTMTTKFRAYYPRLIQANNRVYLELVAWGDKPSNIVQNAYGYYRGIIAYIPY